MKFLLLGLLSLFSFQLKSIIAQSENSDLPNMLELTIEDYGLAKSSSRISTSYSIKDYKLDYSYHFNGSMGINNENIHAKKKFAHRMQRELHHFLEEKCANLKSKELNFEGDNSERIIHISLSYVYNGEKSTWSMKGGENIVEKHSDYKKILELEALIRELARLQKNE